MSRGEPPVRKPDADPGGDCTAGDVDQLCRALAAGVYRGDRADR